MPCQPNPNPNPNPNLRALTPDHRKLATHPNPNTDPNPSTDSGASPAPNPRSLDAHGNIVENATVSSLTARGELALALALALTLALPLTLPLILPLALTLALPLALALVLALTLPRLHLRRGVLRHLHARPLHSLPGAAHPGEPCLGFGLQPSPDPKPTPSPEQVLTGESWSEAVARPTMFGKGGGADGKGMNGGAVLPRTLEACPYP